MTVKFCSVEVPVLDGYAFTIDGNSKITASQGSFDDPRPNALSLPHVSCCPGATPECLADCYVHGLTKREAELAAAYKQNERTLHAVLLTKGRTVQAARALGTWIGEHCPEFRWHVSGDVISARHAQFILEVCGWSRRTQHWIYTRTHVEEVLDVLTLAPNLALNLSCDASHDMRRVRHLAAVYRARVCYMTRDGSLPDWLPPGSVVFPSYGVRAMGLPWLRSLPIATRRQVCPSDMFGHSPAMRCGPCRKCMSSPAPMGRHTRCKFCRAETGHSKPRPVICDDCATYRGEPLESERE